MILVPNYIPFNQNVYLHDTRFLFTKMKFLKMKQATLFHTIDLLVRLSNRSISERKSEFTYPTLPTFSSGTKTHKQTNKQMNQYDLHG